MEMEMKIIELNDTTIELMELIQNEKINLNEVQNILNQYSYKNRYVSATDAKNIMKQLKVSCQHREYLLNDLHYKETATSFRSKYADEFEDRNKVVYGRSFKLFDILVAINEYNINEEIRNKINCTIRQVKENTIAEKKQIKEENNKIEYTLKLKNDYDDFIASEMEGKDVLEMMLLGMNLPTFEEWKQNKIINVVGE